MHTYTEIMGQGGIDRIVQKHCRKGRRKVMPNQPDYLTAKAEYNTPRIKVAEYVAPKPKREPTEEEVAEKELNDSDKVMPRYVEDLYDTLVTAQVLTIAQLPAIASERLAKKKSWRRKLRVLRAAKEAVVALPEPTVEPTEGDPQ
jgi:hypothetical protein